MTIRVLLFASLAQHVGAQELTVELPDSATVGEALQQLGRTHAAIAAMGDRLATAVNMSYVKPTHRLKPGDELALIPPVSGG